MMTALIPFNRKRNDLMNTGFNDFQNMLDDFFAEGWPMRRSLAGDTFKIDLQDNEKEYIVEAELPGFQKNEISLSLEEGRLQIAVKKEETKEETDKNYVHRERKFTAMTRNVFLADAASDDIKAKLTDGVLTITVPKQAKPELTRQIEIE
ncbi:MULTISPECIES: Hsp20/alpha crystallin family protein [Acetobacterium]|jgi:HSP20 family protein|nr:MULTISPECIES: Hsp20/alpha crystallin family protein [Acetobacterium]MEA4807599.1 Hsp20/alpha crystallin family protein [Acetobacterium wieringae]